MARGRIYDDITQTVGNTPLVRLRKLGAGFPGIVLVKHEGFNPFSSVKDRIGNAMVEDAIRSGALKPGMVIVEPTSGNTGIGLAYTAVAKGFRCVITMPDTMTIERRRMLEALGAVLVLTEGAKGMKGAIARGEEILAKLGSRGWMARQFDNPANADIHYRTTGPEIWEDTAGAVDILVSGVGTGGTITGAGRFLREKKPSVRVVAVEPAESAVLSGGNAGPHKQQGLGAGFVPSVLDTTVYDEVVRVTNDDAIDTARVLAREEAIFGGISGGSIAWAALQLAGRAENRGKTIVSIVPDFGERYLSNPVYADMPKPDAADIADALAEG
ncbi:MAG: cysteine synthase A [Burkholderiaceae bacterium]|nr:cysteine synthase A [Burkholderiaceae bacterium]